MTTNTAFWKRRDMAPGSDETWERNLEDRIYGHCSQYKASKNWFWQAVRGDFRLSGITTSSEEAMAAADTQLALPICDFNALVASDLRDEIKNLECQLLSLIPDTMLLPGYHAGYEAGFADVTKRIREALNIEPMELSA